jgi:hypothetical protein
MARSGPDRPGAIDYSGNRMTSPVVLGTHPMREGAKRVCNLHAL